MYTLPLEILLPVILERSVSEVIESPANPYRAYSLFTITYYLLLFCFLANKNFTIAAPMMIAPIPLWLAIINIVVLPISTAFAEDGLYLGCGVNQIKNKYAAIVIPALLFALQHSFIPTLFDLKYMIYRFLSFLPLTIILCMNYHKKKNPVPIMVGHAIIDVATAVQILATSMIPGLYETMCNM